MVDGDPRVAHARGFIMKLGISALIIFLELAVSLSAADLAHAPPDELLHLYQQLRSLQGSEQGAVAENALSRCGRRR
jgi:hypothetical protein